MSVNYDIDGQIFYNIPALGKGTPKSVLTVQELCRATSRKRGRKTESDGEASRGTVCY